MATRGVGLDVVDVARFGEVLARRPRLVERLFTDLERRDARGRSDRLAARFAAKEAVLKALGRGVGAAPWRAIEVVREPSGAPRVVLHDGARALARAAGVTTWHVSLTHSATTAGAIVVASDDDARAR